MAAVDVCRRLDVAFVGVAYYYLTQDTPEGNFGDLRAAGQMTAKSSKGAFLEAVRDHRVWALFVAYGCCFGIEITMENVIVLYLLDYFEYFKQIDPGQALKRRACSLRCSADEHLRARWGAGWRSYRVCC